MSGSKRRKLLKRRGQKTSQLESAFTPTLHSILYDILSVQLCETVDGIKK